MTSKSSSWRWGRGSAWPAAMFPLRVRDEETGEVEEFFLDLLFYNFLLRRFVVIDLKIEDFKPEFAGKMNFYLQAVDELVRADGDGATMGLVLCPGRSRTVTQWALRGLDAPVAVARYTTGTVSPKRLDHDRRDTRHPQAGSPGAAAASERADRHRRCRRPWCTATPQRVHLVSYTAFVQQVAAQPLALVACAGVPFSGMPKRLDFL